MVMPHALKFQSTPGYEAGRFARKRLLIPASTCFNPRPAMKPGDSVAQVQAPHARRGFNPRPAMKPGDSTLIVNDGDEFLLFQSTPGYEAGRFVVAARGFALDQDVSIHARL